MSSEFRISTSSLPRALLEADCTDLRWLNEDRPPDPVTPGIWGAFRDRISTRIISIEYEDGQLAVTVPVGSAPEDCDLALGIVRRVATAAGVEVETEVGKLVFPEVDAVFGDKWQHDQLESAARTVIHLIRERGGPIAMPGPTRSVHIGERVIAELVDGDPGKIGDRLVAVARRVLWPDPRYESAALMTANTPDGAEQFTLTMLLPERPCVLPAADRIAVDDPSGAFLIPRSALEQLPVQATYLDDRNQLVEPVSASDWPALCEVARRYEMS